MRFVFILFIFFSFSDAGQKKIILGSFESQEKAEEFVPKLNLTMAQELKQSLKQSKSNFVIRKQRDMYVVSLEPIQSVTEAKDIKLKLPSPLNQTAFINVFLDLQENVIQTLPVSLIQVSNIDALDKVELDDEKTKKQKKVQLKEGFYFTILIEKSMNFLLPYVVAFKSFVLRFSFIVGFLCLVGAFILYRLSDKKAINLKKKIETIEKLSKEQEDQIQALKAQTYNIKTYYDRLIDSFRNPIKSINKNITKFEDSIEDIRLVNTAKNLSNLLSSHEELRGNIIIEQNEFNLNALVKKQILQEQHKNSKLVYDFDLKILDKVMGDDNKVARILSILIKFSNKYASRNSRLLVALSEANQDIEGNIDISIIIKTNKNGFSEDGFKKIRQAFAPEDKLKNLKLEDDVKDLIIAKRLIASMRGELLFKGKLKSENMFLFNIELKLISRQALLESFVSRKYTLKSNVILFQKDKKWARDILDELDMLNVPVRVFDDADIMMQKLEDVFFFVDILIIKNCDLDFLSLEELVKKASDKNFALLVVIEEGEKENYKLEEVAKVFSKKHQEKILIKKLQKPYKKESFFKSISSIYEEQKPRS